MSKLYPVGAATYSKHPSRYPCGTPRIATSARGAFVVGDDGQPYVDMTSGMGAVLLGHRHPYVDSAIRRQLNAGFAFPLPSRLEEGVAERLVFMLTWERAESVRFGKNGADVTTSAVRLARAMRPSRPDVLYCYASDTDVLTAGRGFVPVSDVIAGEQVYSLDPATLEVRRSVVLRTSQRRYCGDMIHFKTSTTDLLVTPEHRVLRGWKNREGRLYRWSLEAAESVVSHAQTEMFAGGSWKGTTPAEHIIPAIPNGRRRSKGVTRFVPRVFAEFVGYFVSEGCCVSAAGPRYAIKLSQADGSIKDRMEAVVAEMGFLPTRHGPHGLVFHSKELWHWLREQCGDGARNKRLPWGMMLWGPEELGAMLAALIDGDGTRGPGSREVFYTTSPTLADQVQEIAVKLGRGSSVSLITGAGYSPRSQVYHVRLRDSGARSVARDRKARVSYDGEVHCLTLDRDHTVYVRRNGRSVWSGNCDYHGHNDWSMTEPPMNAGVYWNSDVSKKVPRDIDEIRGHAIADKPCAIVIESVSSVTAQPDPPGFWPALRALCDEHKMLLILDEIVTGFRMAAGGAAEVLGIEPDLACYGKAMANGLPLSAIVGPWDILKRYEDDVFFSLTHGGEALSLAAARATLECVCEYDVPHVIGALGDEIINLFREHDAPLSYGYPQRLVADFTDDQASALLRRRVLCAGYMNLTLAHAEQRVAREHLLESLSWVLSRT